MKLRGNTQGGFGVSAVLPTSGTQTYIKNNNNFLFPGCYAVPSLYIYTIWILTVIHYLNYPDLLPYWPRSSVGRALEDLIKRSNPTEVKFSLTRGDSQISFKGVIPKGDLVYRQYCLLPAPKHILKIISRQGAPGRRATCLACKRFDAFSKETYEK